jgi:hypothetical protein
MRRASLLALPQNQASSDYWKLVDSLFPVLSYRKKAKKYKLISPKKEPQPVG